MIISHQNMSVSKSLLTELVQPSFFDIQSPMHGLAEMADEVIKNQRKLEALAARAPMDNIRSVLEGAQRGAAAVEFLNTKASIGAEILNEQFSSAELLGDSFKRFSAPNEHPNISQPDMSLALAPIKDPTLGIFDQVKENMASMARYHDDHQSGILSASAEILAMNNPPSAALTEFTKGFSCYFDDINERIESAFSSIEDVRTSAMASMDVAREIEEKAVKQARAVTQNIGKYVKKALDKSNVDFDSLMVDCVNSPEFVDFYDHATKPKVSDETFLVTQINILKDELQEHKVAIKQSNHLTEELIAQNKRSSVRSFLINLSASLLTGLAFYGVDKLTEKSTPEFAQMKQDMIMYQNCSMDVTTVGKITTGEIYRAINKGETCFEITFKTKLGTTITGYVDPYRLVP